MADSMDVKYLVKKTLPIDIVSRKDTVVCADIRNREWDKLKRLVDSKLEELISQKDPFLSNFSNCHVVVTITLVKKS